MAKNKHTTAENGIQSENSKYPQCCNMCEEHIAEANILRLKEKTSYLDAYLELYFPESVQSLYNDDPYFADLPIQIWREETKSRYDSILQQLLDMDKELSDWKRLIEKLSNKSDASDDCSRRNCTKSWPGYPLCTGLCENFVENIPRWGCSFPALPKPGEGMS